MHPEKTEEVAREVMVVPAPQPVSFMEMIAQNVGNPEFDAAKLHSLIDANERIINRQSSMDYDAAMIRLQEKLANVKIIKDSKIVFSGVDKKGNAYTQETPYAKLEGIDTIIRPLMREEGFVVTYLTEGTDRVVVKCKITHIGGHSEISSMTLPLDTSGSKNNLQGAGSSISYGRRYTLCAMLNLITVGEDDDGNGGAIDDAQAARIKELIKASGADTVAFLKYMKAPNVEEILFKDYRKATSALEEKIKKAAKAEEKKNG
jgi:hypothetical protein